MPPETSVKIVGGRPIFQVVTSQTAMAQGFLPPKVKVRSAAYFIPAFWYFRLILLPQAATDFAQCSVSPPGLRRTSLGVPRELVK
jgi:hypothetical protein